MVEAIRIQRIKKINTDESEHVLYPKFSKNWVSQFLKRHPNLHTVRGRSIEATRIRESFPEVLKKWFEEFKRVIEELGIDIENIYNMDETGFLIETIKTSNIIISKDTRMKLQVTPGRQEWISVVECISIDRVAISPLIIFKGERLSDAWYPDDVDESWKFSCQPKGWTTNFHGLQWFQTCFEPATRERSDDACKPRVLIFNGHESHLSSEFLAHALNNNIHLLMLPPHTSHLLQPLNAEVFGLLKSAMSKCLDRLIQTGIARLEKVEWVEKYIEACPYAFTQSNIDDAWHEAGLFPFSRQKVLRKIIDPPSLERPKTPPTIVQQPTIPFHDVKSSPLDAQILHSANAHLNRMVQECTELPTPACNYIRRVTNFAEEFQAELAITRT